MILNSFYVARCDICPFKKVVGHLHGCNTICMKSTNNYLDVGYNVKNMTYNLNCPLLPEFKLGEPVQIKLERV